MTNLKKSSNSDQSCFKIKKKLLFLVTKVPKENGGFEIVPAKAKKNKVPVLTPEELAVGQMLVTSKKRRRDMMDAAWNRYMFDDRDQVTF